MDLMQRNSECASLINLQQTSTQYNELMNCLPIQCFNNNNNNNNNNIECSLKTNEPTLGSHDTTKLTLKDDDEDDDDDADADSLCAVSDLTAPLTINIGDDIDGDDNNGDNEGEVILNGDVKNFSTEVRDAEKSSIGNILLSVPDVTSVRFGPRNSASSDRLMAMEKQTHSGVLQTSFEDSTKDSLNISSSSQISAGLSVYGQATRSPIGSILDGSAGLRQSLILNKPMVGQLNSSPTLINSCTPGMGSLVNRFTMDVSDGKSDVMKHVEPQPSSYVMKARTTPAREAVDPAKYFTVTDDPDGTKYACSKCGNVYKWRKSLNKHWKEKHDGEVPEPRVHTASLSTRVNVEGKKSESSPRIKSVSLVKRAGYSMSCGPSVLNVDATAKCNPTVRYPPISSISPKFEFNTVLNFGGNQVGKSLLMPHFQNPPSMNQTPQKTLPVWPSGMIGNVAQLTDKDFFGLPLYAQGNSFPSFSGNTMNYLPFTERDSMPLDMTKSPLEMLSSYANELSEGALDLSVKSESSAGKETADEMENPDLPIDFSCKLSKSDATSPARSSTFSSPTGSTCSVKGSSEVSIEKSLKAKDLGFSKQDGGRVNQCKIGGVMRCNVCCTVFPSGEELNKHFSKCHIDQLWTLSAGNVCQDLTGNRERLTANQKLYRHSAKNPSGPSLRCISCVVCGQTFQFLYLLEQHFDQLHLSAAGGKNPYRSSSILEQKILINSPDGSPVMITVQQPTGNIPVAHGYNTAVRAGKLMHKNAIESSKRVNLGNIGIVLVQNDVKVGKISPSSSSESMLGLVPEDDVGFIDSDTTIVIPQAPEEDGSQISSLSLQHISPDTSSNYHSIFGPQGNRLDHLKADQSINKVEFDGKDCQFLPYGCELCEYRARWPSEMTQHMKNHSDEKPYKCSRCSYRSKWKWDVVKHLKRCSLPTDPGAVLVMEGESSYPLPNSPIPLTAHQLNRKKKNKNKSLLLTSSSINHSFTVSCGMNTSVSNLNLSSDISDLQNGTLGHDMESYMEQSEDTRSPLPSSTNQLVHYCVQCPFIGHSPAELKRHLRVHSDEKPYSCGSCNYSSKWKCDLKKHLKAYNHIPAIPLQFTGLSSALPSNSSEAGINTANTNSMANDNQKESISGIFKRGGDFVKVENDFRLIKEDFQPQGELISGGCLRCKRCGLEVVDITSYTAHVNSAACTQIESIKIEKVGGVWNRKSCKPGKVGKILMLENKIEEVKSEDCSSDSLNSVTEGGGDKMEVQFWNSLNLQMKKNVKINVTSPVDFSAGIEDKYSGMECATKLGETSGMKIDSGENSSKYTEESDRGKLKDSELDVKLTENVKVDMKWVDNCELDVATDLSKPKINCNILPNNEYKSPNTLLNGSHCQNISDNGEECLNLSTNYANKETKPHANNTKLRWPLFEGRSRFRVTTTEAEDAAGMSKRKRKLRACAKCGYVTDNLTTLQRHVAKHGSGGRHKCGKCDYSVDRQHILDYHIRNVHELPATFVGCPQQILPLPLPDRKQENKTKMASSSVDKMVGIEKVENLGNGMKPESLKSSQCFDLINDKVHESTQNGSSVILQNDEFAARAGSSSNNMLIECGNPSESVCSQVTEESVVNVENKHEIFPSLSMSKNRRICYVCGFATLNSARMRRHKLLYCCSKSVGNSRRWKISLSRQDSNVSLDNNNTITIQSSNLISENTSHTSLDSPDGSTNITTLGNELVVKELSNTIRISDAESENVIRKRKHSIDNNGEVSKKAAKLSLCHCPSCPFKCPSVSQLVMHARCHGADRRFTCSSCDFSTNLYGLYSSHQLLHNVLFI